MTTRHPELSDWEPAKENILPLKQGRKASTLSKIFHDSSENPIERKQSIKEEKEKWINRISLQNDDEVDDPLDIYFRYLLWLQEYILEGGNMIIGSLETITKRFASDCRYKNDPRFVKCWLLYAQELVEPLDVFSYMVTNEIGLETAAFYEDYALLMEFGSKKIQEADQIFQAGINRGAQPIQRLKKSFLAFEKRIMSRAQDSYTVPEKSERTPLSSTSGHLAFSKPTNNPIAKFKVYADECTSITSKGINYSTPWFKLPSCKSTSKENIVLPRPWINERYPNPTIQNISTEKFHVYRDKKTIVRSLIKGYKEDLFFNGECEISFEELRARDYLIKMKILPWEKVQKSSTDQVCNPIITKIRENFQVPSEASAKIASPTVNTKAALAEIYKMFNDPLISEQISEDEFEPTPNILDISPPKIAIYQDNTTDVKRILERKKELLTIVEATEKPLKSALKQKPSLGDPLKESIPRPVKEPENPFVDLEPNNALQHPPYIPILREEGPSSIFTFSQAFTSGKLLTLESVLSRMKGYYRFSNPNPNNLRLKSLEDEQLQIMDDTFYVRKELGQGAFGKVLLAAHVGSIKDITVQTTNWAIKIQNPPSAWEFYILRTLRNRLSDYSKISVINAINYYEYTDTCFLKMDYNDQGTLHKLICYQDGGVMEELLAMFYTVELIKIIRSLHAVGIIHCDIKADNLLIRMGDSENESTWSSQYQPDGSHEWNQKGLLLIDFGRAVDMTLLPPCSKLKVPWKPDEDDCWQVKQSCPITYEIDYHGLAGVAHQMLFGNFIKVSNDPISGQAKMSSTLKRYWRTDIWTKFFSFLLNPPSQLPADELLLEIQNEMSKVLVNYNKPKSLKMILKRQEIIICEKAIES